MIEPFVVDAFITVSVGGVLSLTSETSTETVTEGSAAKSTLDIVAPELSLNTQYCSSLVTVISNCL